MKTRTLFLTIFTLISILLIAQGFAFAKPKQITGCIKNATGIIYNVQIGAEPTSPCSFLDTQITWNQEGLEGPAGC